MKLEETRVGLKWTEFDDDVLAAWVAEMDFGLAPAVSDALHAAVDRSLTGYPFPELESAVAVSASTFWADHFDWAIDPEWIFSAPDVVEGLRRAISHLTRPGSPVILHSPVYYPFYGMVERAQRELIEIQGVREQSGKYVLDLSAIGRALADGAGSIVLCNPWNPTGRVFTEAELSEVSELARNHDARIIADEIHSPITYPGHTHTPVARLDPERTVTVASASKAWNLPGLKCAQVVLTSEEDRSRWDEYFTPEKVGVSTFGLIANEAAYREGRSWFEAVLSRLEGNRNLLTELMRRHLPEVVYHEPEGTYLAWLDLGAYEIADPAGFLLEEARVATTGGEPFGTGASRFVRFNFATDDALIEEMVERMARALRAI